MINVHFKTNNITELELSGEVSASDYEKITPKIEKRFADKGPQKFIFLMKNPKFTLGAVLADIKFDLLHFKNIGKTAVVGRSGVVKGITKFVNILYPVKVKHFKRRDAGLAWLRKVSP